jgi:hypothetical protein
MDAWKIGCENVNWIELSKIIILSISLLWNVGVTCVKYGENRNMYSIF